MRRPRWTEAVLAFGALAAGALPHPAAAQTAVANLAFERAARERWMNAHQSPAFTPWVDSRISFRIAGSSDSAGYRALQLAMHPNSYTVVDVLVTVDRDGRIGSIIGAPSWRPPPGIYPVPSAPPVALRAIDPGGITASNGPLPATLAWDFVPAFHPRRLGVGERWVDTVALSATSRGSDQRIAGVRTSTIVGDTLVRGLTLWRVRDLMQATYHERVWSDYSTRGKLFSIDRTATGTIRGEYLYHPGSRLSLVRTDTTDLRGTAVLSLPDGRSFTTPARYERTRSFVAYDSAHYRSHQADLVRGEAEQRASETLPASVQVKGRTEAVLDSLLGEWSRSRDVDQRARLRFIVMGLVTSDVYYSAPFRDRLDGLLFASGDTVLALNELSFSLWLYKSMDTAALSVLLPIFRDPGHAFALGVTDPGYDNVVQALYDHPMGNLDGGESAAPTRAAREMLGREWYSATDPRLRDVALMALLTLDPARWSDTVVARQHAGEILLDRAAERIRGQVSRDTPALPERGADWHAWVGWVAYEPMRDETGAPPPMSVGPDHIRAVRFFEARTGRNLVAEWRQQLATAADDSARYVFESLLFPFHAWTPPSLDSIARQLRVGNALNYERAMNGFDDAFAKAAHPADSALATEIANRVLSHVMDGDPVWPVIKPSWDTLPPDTPGGAPERDQGLSGEPPHPVFVYLKDLPAPVHGRWSERVTWVADSAWQVPPERSPAVLISIEPIVGAGPFVRVRWARVRYPIDPSAYDEEHPDPEAAGDLLLMRTPTGWVSVPSTFFPDVD